jgi:hypothetical protein
MPRGVYKRKPVGLRKKDLREQNTAAFMHSTNVNTIPTETDAEIDARIAERFEVLEEMSQAAIDGEVRAMIVSGPAGLGKSWTVEAALEKWDPSGLNHTILKGYIKATGLFKMLYQYRNRGQVIVFDDADSLFFDDVALNLLKAVCDTTEKRRVSWRSELVMTDEDENTVPHDFEFDGSIIFITNMDFDAQIERGSKIAPHLQALVSRSHYIDLTMKNRRDYIMRIRQVVKQGLLKDSGLSKEAQDEVVAFVVDNQARMRELSLRIVLKVATYRRINPTKWQSRARVTCTRA